MEVQASADIFVTLADETRGVWGAGQLRTMTDALESSLTDCRKAPPFPITEPTFSVGTRNVLEVRTDDLDELLNEGCLLGWPFTNASLGKIGTDPSSTPRSSQIIFFATCILSSEPLRMSCISHASHRVGNMVCDAYLICTARVALVPSQVATLMKAPLFSCSILIVAAFLPMIRPAFECSHSMTIEESSVAHSFLCWPSSPSASNDSPPRSLFPPTSAAGRTCLQFRRCSDIHHPARKIPAQKERLGRLGGTGEGGNGKSRDEEEGDEGAGRECYHVLCHPPLSEKGADRERQSPTPSLRGPPSAARPVQRSISSLKSALFPRLNNAQPPKSMHGGQAASCVN
jgi:hypothetical protein